MCVHRHESASQEVFVPFDGVHGCHQGVDHAVVGEYLHLHGCVEYLFYLTFAHALFLQCAVAVGLSHSACEDAIYLLLAKVLREGGIALFAFLAEEVVLQFLHMCTHGLLGILLHARVDGGVDA